MYQDWAHVEVRIVQVKLGSGQGIKIGPGVLVRVKGKGLMTANSVVWMR